MTRLSTFLWLPLLIGAIRDYRGWAYFAYVIAVAVMTYLLALAINWLTSRYEIRRREM